MRVVPILSILLLATVPAVAEQAAPQVCFTPGGKCTDLIVSEIASARQSILVQAYSFTSVPILAALKAAHARGVDVEVIVDKTSARQSKSGSRYSAATYLTNAGIPVWVDTKVAIAHNKVMVIDGDDGYHRQLQLHGRGAEVAMPRTCWCSMIRRWRRSTRRIGSGGGRCRRLMWGVAAVNDGRGRIAPRGVPSGRQSGEAVTWHQAEAQQRSEAAQP